jgi:GntR family transcriptional regulator/MocR family aminotransferase
MENKCIQNKRVSIAGTHLERASAMPLHQLIAAHMHSGIVRGIFPAGTSFLGSREREIAKELGCSRTVVLTAWDLLYAEGYLESMPRGIVTAAPVSQAHAGAGTIASASSDPAPAFLDKGSISNRWQSLLAFEYDTNRKSESALARRISRPSPSRNGRDC